MSKQFKRFASVNSCIIGATGPIYASFNGPAWTATSDVLVEVALSRSGNSYNASEHSAMAGQRVTPSAWEFSREYPDVTMEVWSSSKRKNRIIGGFFGGQS
jgi:hypothetical protein